MTIPDGEPLYKDGDMLICIGPLKSLPHLRKLLTIGQTYKVDSNCDHAFNRISGWHCVVIDNAGLHSIVPENIFKKA
jgi:hypothetical protein